MSKLIEQIIEVLDIVKDLHRKDPATDTSQHRIDAVEQVAKQRGIDPTTVDDKYNRRLKPDIDKTEDFNEVVDRWLRKGSPELQHILLRHSKKDDEDKERVKRFFSTPPGRVRDVQKRSQVATSPAHPVTQTPPTPEAEDTEETNVPDRVFPDEVPAGTVFREGRVLQIAVNAYERNPAARRQCIKHFGAVCVVCGFNFGDAYGQVAEGLIHVHHLRAISEVGEQYEIDPIEDLRPVCPNCHAVIHLRESPYTIKEVKGFLRPAARKPVARRHA